MFLIGFTGRSGSGKTTLAEAVLRVLVSRGFSVSCIKDAHHKIDLDTEGKDTYRYREGGASQVVIRTPERWALMEETPGERKPLSEILRAIKPADIVMIEGFKHEGSFPKIEVIRDGTEDPLCVSRAEICAVASDRELKLPDGVEALDINDPEKIADFILRLMEVDSVNPLKSSGTQS